jgi:hypothetical protein
MILDHDLHLHLHGCVSAEDLWELGKDRFAQSEDRLNWFVAEFESTWGYRPEPNKYFSHSNGLELLRRDFLMAESGTFPQFQAKFNLLIALLPITPGDDSLVRFVLRHQANQGLKYGEYRVWIPTDFSETQLGDYFTMLCKTFTEMARELAPFIPKLVLSLNREGLIGIKQYRILKNWQQQNQELASPLVAVDFSGYEESHPPIDKKHLLSQILRDNKADPKNALAILYHVGESFNKLSMMSAARWVHQAALLGCHRLGHAIALGMNPQSMLDQEVLEPKRERVDHEKWLLDHQKKLAAVGYNFDPHILRKDMNVIRDEDDDYRHLLIYSNQVVEECGKLQEALIEAIKSTHIVIESCPTSNFKLGNVKSPVLHPLPRFVQSNLKVVIGADDPGIFDSQLADEEVVCRQQFGFDDAILNHLNDTARNSRSEILSGRLA